MRSISEMATKIATNEGKRKELNIAQIKEVLKWTAIILADDAEMKEFFYRYGYKKSKELGEKK